MRYIIIGLNCSINLFLLLYFYRAGSFQDADWKQNLLMVAFFISANLINFALYRWLKPSFTFFELLIYVTTTLLVLIVLFFVYIVLGAFIFFLSLHGSLFQN